ncbi:hypothetical protein FPRO04_11647 [Fusarium proliferatum]|nr:hypothetical protein FPRO04_11647 [Fusarium proliferatum]
MGSCQLLRLSDELQVAVVELLPGNALEAARATCRKLNNIASPYLYPVLYLSCHQLDLDVFRLVASNPILIAGVKELVIDDTTLSPRLADWEVYKTLASYTHMWPQRKKTYDWTRRFQEDDRIWSKEPDKEFHDLFKAVLVGHHENRRSNADVTALKGALPLFKSLRSLVISNRTADDDFDTGAQSEESSSPVVKMWRQLGVSKKERPPFPPRCDWIAPWHEPGFRTEVMQLDFFNDELEKYIKEYGLPPTAGEQERRDADTQSDAENVAGNNWFADGFFCRIIGREARAIVIALEVLEHPSIRLSEFRVDASLEKSMDQGNIARLLASMPQLEDLLLEPHGMSIFSAIPDDVTFSRLRRAEFSCGAIDPQKLVSFIERHAPTLKFITVQYCSIDPDIFEDTWEHVMRDIRLMQKANTLEIYDGQVAGVFDGEPCRGCGKNGTIDIESTSWLLRNWEFVFFSFWRQYHEYPWNLHSDGENGEGDEDDDSGGDGDENDASGL